MLGAGSITVDGIKTQLMPDFVQTTLQLSQFLSVSERYAASLLQAGSESRWQWSRSSIDTASLLYHRERLELLGTLKELLASFIQAHSDAIEHASSGELALQLETFLSALLSTDAPGSTGTNTNLVASLLALLDTVDVQSKQLTERAQYGIIQPGAAFFTDDLILETLSSLRQEAQDAGHVLALLAFSGALQPNHTRALLAWLENVPTAQFGAHAIYVMTAALAALEPRDVLYDQSFVADVTDLVATPARWKTPAIGSALALQWIITMTETLPALAGSAVELQRQQERLQELASKTVQSGVFAFLSLDVLAFRAEQRKDDVWQTTPEESASTSSSDELTKAHLDPTFQTYVLDQVQSLVENVTTVMLPLLKRIQRTEEDAAFFSSRGRASVTADAATLLPQRNDIQQLFDLIATLTSGRPEAGLHFWVDAKGRQTPFLLWATDLRDFKIQLSLLAMLGALASGPESAMHAFELLSQSDPGGARELGGTKLTTWARLFDWIQFYVDTFQKASLTQEMDPFEANQLIAFLNLLRNVAYYSQPARAALYGNPKFQATENLFRLALLQIHADLKAALLHALAAFARRDNPGAGQVGQHIWKMIASTDLLGTGKSYWNAQLGRHIPGSGAVYQLEHVEAERKAYPATTALVDLLTALVPYVPDNTDSYVQFVIQHVFLKAAGREYAEPTERWKVTVVCLEFFLRCLREFRLPSWPLNRGSPASKPEMQPGFLVAKDILLNEALAKEIFSLLNTGFETLNKAQSVLLTKTIRLSLQCLKRVFELQDPFLRDLLPCLTDASHDLSRLGTVANYAPLDRHLLYSNQTVGAIALYINATSVSVALLSIQLMGYLASSDSFSAPERFSLAGGRKQLNRLAGLLEMMGETSRVRAGYIRLLGTEDGGLVLDKDEDDQAQQALGAGEVAPLHAGSIRITILNFLITHIRLQPPNVAHLLLGYDVSTTAAEAPPLPDPSAPTTQATVISAILALIRPDNGSLQALLVQHPDLTERCFQLLLDLCSEPYSSAATLHYLRTYENFLVSHLPAIPFAPTAREGGMGKVVYSDRPAVQTSVNAASANLRIKAALLEMIALQIHAVTNAGMINVALPLVSMLMDSQGADGVQMISLLNSMCFQWQDERDMLRSSMTMLANLNDEQARGVTMPFDLERARSNIELARRELMREGELPDAASRQTFEQDAARWIRWMVGQNAHESINYARRLALTHWRHALAMILSRCGTLVRSEERMNVLFTVLGTLLPIVTTNPDPSIVETVSGAVLELIASLRGTSQDRADLRYDLFPADRILLTLRSLLASILQPGTSILARGNLYSALINFLQFAYKEDILASGGGADDWDNKSETLASVAGPSASLARSTVAPHGATIMLRVRMTLSEKVDQLVMRVAKDALDAQDAWKAVAYTLLDKLAGLEGTRSSARSSRVLQVLVQQGYLKAMVSALHDSDLALQACLGPDPGNKLALVVYRAQMTFFVRLATTRQGVEALLDLGIVAVLVKADFISASPESNQVFTDLEGFLPAARERYAALLTPVLELLTAMLSLSPVASGPISQLLTLQGEALGTLLHAVLANVVSISQVRQAHLLVILLGLRASLDPAPLPPNAPNYHQQLLAVTAGFLTKPAWSQRVLASTETEREQCGQVVARDGQTVFDRCVLLAVERLQQSLLAYLEAVSRPLSLGRVGGVPQPIKSVLTPSLATQTSVDSTPGQLPQRSGGPSLGAAMQALEEEWEKFSVRLARLDKVLSVADNPTTASLDDLEELLGIEVPLSSSELTEAAGQPALASRLLHRRARTLVGSITHGLSVIEVLLVLLYRHFEYYLALPDAQLAEQTLPTLGFGLGFGSNTSPARAAGHTPVDKARLATWGRDKLAAIAERAGEVALTPTHLPDALEREAFIEMLLRKTQQLLFHPIGSSTGL